jgi:hypothetical protein
MIAVAHSPVDLCGQSSDVHQRRARAAMTNSSNEKKKSYVCVGEGAAAVKRSRFSSKGKSTDTIYNVVDHESNLSHYQLSADIIVIHRRITSLHKLYNTG